MGLAYRRRPGATFWVRGLVREEMAHLLPPKGKRKVGPGTPEIELLKLQPEVFGPFDSLITRPQREGKKFILTAARAMAAHDEMMYPPGTVTLIDFQEATETKRVVLSPQPSSDPNEPLNWPLWRKNLNMALIFGMTIAAFAVLMIQTVFWQQMVVDMPVTITDLSNAQSAQLAGLAVGCLFFIPLTVKYGRRPTYILSTAVLAATAWWSAKMTTLWELMVTSVVSGLAGAINETAVQMTIADLFFVHQRGRANGVYFVAVNFGSFLCPLAAGAQAATQGWRFSYYALSICLTILFVAFCFLYEETKYVPVNIGSVQVATHSIEDDQEAKTDATSQDKLSPLNRTRSQSISSPPTYQTHTYSQRMRLWTPTDESLWKVFILPLHVITLPHVMFTALQFASGVAWLVLLMAMTSVIFSAPPYNFDTSGVGYMTLGPFVGNVLGNIYGGPMSDWFVLRIAKRNGRLFEPEMRLHQLCVSVVFMAGGLIMFGVTSDKGLHWILPSIGGALFAFGLGSTGEIAFTMLIDSYTKLTAEAFVGVAFLRNAVSIGIPSAMVPWWTAMGLSNMYIVCGFVSLAIGLLYVPLVIWGKKIRIALTPRYESLIAKKGLS
ncbi:hypothetical protein JX265_004595 [Neoarthrinium moseri]|uniref:Major facilitator superfamily (MFS) profile domain-containing protein n=1 Tax=Neoarthrinium moseri TaxID=1658444 RepID=A0A9Q0AN72_9PEZI|nr:hypothetical protein JX265_004595 [Neoarthrinium moseri]